MRLFMVCLCLFFIATSAGADQVRPSDRVSNYVNVRQSAAVNSPGVGILKPNQTATLIESIPYWHHVRMVDGTAGYVSKAWTVVVSGGTPSPAAGKTDLVIGSWNIKWFGYYDEVKHGYDRMAAIIETFDVVAIQELRGENYGDRLDKLIAALSIRGYSYTYTVSQETGYLDHPDKADATAPKKDYLERYAFMWDTDRVDLVSPSAPHAFVGSPRINNATYRQVPIYADFKVSNGNRFDFRILTIHTVYNEKINAVRRAEIQAVNDWIIDQSTNPAHSEKNIVAMGDFNANPKGQPHHFEEIIKGTTDYRVLMNEPLAAGENSLRTTVQQWPYSNKGTKTLIAFLE
jgi:endonuclease/exonuclease/phosphatase family metal-dependent hydrolase